MIARIQGVDTCYIFNQYLINTFICYKGLSMISMNHQNLKKASWSIHTIQKRKLLRQQMITLMIIDVKDVDS